MEVIQQHEGGCIYLHGLSRRRVLLVRCQDHPSIAAVRLACHLFANQEAATKPLVRKVSQPAVSDLVAAFHAEPAW